LTWPNFVIFGSVAECDIHFIKFFLGSRMKVWFAFAQL